MPDCSGYPGSAFLPRQLLAGAEQQMLPVKEAKAQELSSLPVPHSLVCNEAGHLISGQPQCFPWIPSLFQLIIFFSPSWPLQIFQFETSGQQNQVLVKALKLDKVFLDIFCMPQKANIQVSVQRREIQEAAYLVSTLDKKNPERPHVV